MRVSGKLYTSQLPLGERVMYEPIDNLNQRWSHEIWMTDECFILTENGIQKATSLHRATPKEKFFISELEESSKISLERRGRELEVSD